MALSGLGLADQRRARYALVLHDPPMADAPVSGKAHAESRLRAAQTTLRMALDDRGVTVTGTTQTVLNAVYVVAPEDEADELRRLPGVARVVEMLPIKRKAIKALDLVRAPEAWRNIGGEANAGAGVRIAVLDTGIDQSHPAFVDPSLQPPPGYPRCAPDDCPLATNKVIAVRSYVQMLVLGDNPLDSRPDDLSARDHVGHGTAVAMLAAGTRHDSPLGPTSGMAPRAYLGNYKIFGSPGVNDITFDDVVIRALDDAVRDGMHIAVLSLGRPAIWAPDDRGSTCDLANDRPCDPWADAVDRATKQGLTVVVASGNDGDVGIYAPSYNSVHTPGTVATALTVGASTNSQRYFSAVRVNGAPSPLDALPVQLGDGPRMQSPLRARLIDLTALSGEDSRACQGIGNGTLSGHIAIVQQGGCAFSTKVNNAQKAGAVGVIVQRPEGFNALFPMSGLKETGIPAALIGSTNGKLLQDYLKNNAGIEVTLDPTLAPFAFDSDDVAFFSSYGPGIGGGIIKPEVVAPGQTIYMATQRSNPYGDMFSPDGFIAAQGTSFATPIAAGAAALFKQRFINATAAQVKSAVVNTAIAEVGDYDRSDNPVQASVLSVGAGKVHAGRVALTNVTVEPSTLSFGYLGTALPSVGVIINNHGTSALDIRISIAPRFRGANENVTVDQTSFSLNSGTSRQVSVRITGTRPVAGIYEGDVVVGGGAVPLRVPYLYLVGDGVADNLVPLRGFDFVNQVNTRMRIAFKAVDKFGVPARNIPVRYRSTLGDGSIAVAFPRTDDLGISDATVVIGPRLGEQEYAAEAGNLTLYFTGRGRLQPSIRTDGVVNWASGQVGRGVAPGSLAAIEGRNLSESARTASTPWLPPGLAGVSVSFDVPERRLSLPGRVLSVDDERVVVQVPWELQGLNSATMKVSIGNAQSDLYTVSLFDVAPALFEVSDPGGRQVAFALDEDGRPVTTENAARREGTVHLHASGLGPVDNRPPSGEPPQSDTLSPVKVLPVVTIGGRPAEVTSSGLATGAVGRYFIRVRIPADASPGVQPVVVTSNGVDSKTSNLPIQ